MLTIILIVGDLLGFLLFLSSLNLSINYNNYVTTIHYFNSGFLLPSLCSY